MGTLEASSRPRVAGALPAGTTLGRFELMGLLSVGGMAEIYLARTEGIAGFEKLVVVKRMLPHFAMQAEFVEMFLAEARLGAMLDHPNVVGVHDIGEDTGNYYYAMEYVRGADLRQLMKVQGSLGEPMPMHCAIAVGLGMCAGLDHAHGLTDASGKLLGVVHRDVSLSNVLVSYDGTVKVTDFGVAKVAAADHRTRTGTLKGKIGYMSPEQCRGHALDRRSDIFSIGIILYELSTCRRLFRSEASDFEILERIVKKDVTPPSKLRPGYPAELEAIVMKALARDRTRRYQTAREMHRDLEALARSERLPATATELGDYVRRMVPPVSLAAERTTQPTAPPATRPASELPGAGVDGWGAEYESLILGDPLALEGVEPPIAPTPQVSLRPRPTAAMVIAAAALAGVLLAVALVPGAEAPRPAAAEEATEVEAVVPTPVIAPASAPAPAAAARREPPPEVVPIAPAAPRASERVAAAERPDREREREQERQREREREQERQRERERARKPSKPAMIETLVDARPPDPEPEPTLVVADLDVTEEAPPPPVTRPAPLPEPRPKPVAPEPKPAPAPDRGTLDAVASVGGIDVKGPLQDSVIRRGADRVLSAFRGCYRRAAKAAGRTPAATVRLSFEIDESRTAKSISAGGSSLPGLTRCIADAAGKIRTRIAPDVGTAQVTIRVEFEPTR